jgi:hypothetical protein
MEGFMAVGAQLLLQNLLGCFSLVACSAGGTALGFSNCFLFHGDGAAWIAGIYKQKKRTMTKSL